jgi:5'-phosphate synthase pdxT subunit
VLAFHGDVVEHVRATEAAARKTSLSCQVAEVRAADDLERLSGLILPGGESTNFYKLCVREKMLERMKSVPAIFGTCAGAIMLAKSIHNSEAGQGTLGLMDIEVDRNAYGRQAASFEEDIRTELGRVHAVFIRAPRIRSVGSGVRVLAERGGEPVACEQRSGGAYLLATCFHPELTTTKFHERFLRALS